MKLPMYRSAGQVGRAPAQRDSRELLHQPISRGKTIHRVRCPASTDQEQTQIVNFDTHYRSMRCFEYSLEGTDTTNCSLAGATRRLRSVVFQPVAQERCDAALDTATQVVTTCRPPPTDKEVLFGWRRVCDPSGAVPSPVVYSLNSLCLDWEM